MSRLRSLLLLRALLQARTMMPPVLSPSNQNLFNALRRMQAQLRAVASQQQGTITNDVGLPVINTGAVPGTTPQAYGYQLVNPSTQAPVGFFGFNGAGTACLEFYDSLGNVVTRFDQTGMHSYDDTGTERVSIGLVNASPAIYGLEVLNSLGVFQLQSGAIQAQALGTVSTTSTSFTSLSGGPSVTATIGPSGMALVTMGAYIQAPAANTSGGSVGQGSVGVSVDGGTPSSGVYLSAPGPFSNVQIGTNQAVPQIITGLSVGSHTFALWYESYPSGGFTTQFSQRVIVVQPL